MLFKSLLIGTAITACLALPVAESVEARASGSLGTIIFYSGSGYSGSTEVASVEQGASEFCEEWTNLNNGKQLFEVKSYAAFDVVCFTFAQSGCAGDASTALTVSQSL